MRRFLMTLGFCLLGAGATLAQQAQSWPNKPVKVVVPFSAGSGVDIVARTVAEALQNQLGQPFIVENRVGAGGTIGINAVAKSDADGYTLLVQSNSFAVAAAAYSNPGYDSLKDFAHVTALVSLPNALVVNPQKYKTLKELVDFAKANPGKMNYASAGAGSGAHLNAERLRIATGTQMQHIAYKGGPEAINGVLGGDCDFYFVPLPPARGLVDAGKLRILAVSGAKRSNALPDVPTTIEAGVPDSDYDFWVGLWAPAATPKPILDRLHAETIKALNDPAVQKKLGNVGGDPMPMTPAQFQAFVKKEIDVNTALVKAANLKLN